MDPELTQELEEELRQLSATIAQFSGALSEQTRAMYNSSTSVNQNNEATKANRQSTSQNTMGQTKLAEASTAASDIMARSAENFRSALDNSREALNGFGSALFSAEEGVGKYGKAVDSAGMAAFDIGKNFGILGFAIGGLIAIFGKVVAETLKLDDNIIKMRDSFTKTAGILPTTTTELGNLAKQARFSLDDMAKLSKATNSLGKNLLGLGGYAGEGALKFMKMANVSDDVRRQYGRLGISQEQLLDLQSKYVEMQGVSGQAMANRSKTEEQLRKESLAYADNLIKMSSLTGKTADELQAARDAAMLEYEEQLQIAAENQQIAELRAAGRKEEADAIQLEQDNRKKLIQTYSDLYGAEQGQLAGRLMRQGAYDEKTAGIAVRDPNMLEFTQKLKTSKDAMGEITKQADKTKQSVGESTVRYGKALQYAGEETGRQLGLQGELVASSNKLAGQSITGSLEKISKDMKDKKEAGKDPLADSIEGIRSFERESKAKLQTFLEDMDPLRHGFDTLKKVAIAAAAALAAVAAAKGLQALLGFGKKPTLETLDKRVSNLETGGPEPKPPIPPTAPPTPDAPAAPQALGSAAAKPTKPVKPKTTAKVPSILGASPAGSVRQKAAPELKYLKSTKRFHEIDPMSGKTGKMVKFSEVEKRAAGGGGSSLNKLTQAANSPGADKSGGFLMSIVRGLEAAGKAGLKLVQGAGYLSAAIAVIGAGIAAATWLMGAALPNLAKGLKSFEKINGPNLKAVGIGMAGLGAGILAMGAGQVAGAVGNVINWFVKGEDPLENSAKQIKKLEAMSFNTPKIKNNSEAIVAFSKAMMAASAMGAAGAGANMAKGIADSINSFFGGKPVTDQLVEFSKLQIDNKNVKKNASAFTVFAEAMSSYKGYGSNSGAAGAAMADAAAGFFKTPPPYQKLVEFGKVQVDEKNVRSNASSFKAFAEAMSSYEGYGSNSGAAGSAIADATAGFFNVSPPYDKMVEFSNIKVNGEKVKNNATAFKLFAEAMSSYKGLGSTLGAIGAAIAESTIKFFGATPPLEQFVSFSWLPINAKKAQNNAIAFRFFSEAMASYKGLGSPVGAISTALASAAYKFFGVKPPLEEFVNFSHLNIDAKKTQNNAKAFVTFSNAMAEYKGGPGLLDSINSLVGKGFNALFGQDGPVESFRKFAKEDFGPRTKDNAEAFRKYAEAHAIIGATAVGGGAGGGGGGGGSSTSRGYEAGKQIGAGAVGAVSGAVGAAYEGATGLIGKGWDALKSAATGMIKASESDLKKAGLKIKEGDVQGPGYDLDKRIIPFAKQVQENVPGFVRFTAMNDRYHHKLSYNSKHKTGKAIDFTLKKKPTKQEGAQLVKMLKAGGAAHAIDEYNNPSGAATAGHMHAQFAEKGGVFRGPSSGYPVTMHGSEMIAPLDVNSVLMKLAKTPANMANSIAETAASMASTGTQTKTGGHVDEQAAMNLELYGMITKKIDNMLNVLENSHDTHNKMLKHARV